MSKIGGKKTKSFAHKQNSQDHNIVLPKEEFEEDLAIVTKICGNGVFYVTSSEGKETIAYLPGKMKHSHYKRFHPVLLSSILLIAYRSWATNKKHSDILQVYSNTQIKQLQSYLPEKISALVHLNNKSVHAQDFEFIDSISETTYKKDNEMDDTSNTDELDISLI
jgi:initiation factor 1A